MPVISGTFTNTSLGYNAHNANIEFGSLTNTKGTLIRIYDVTIRLGTVNGKCTWGDDVTGAGNPIPIHITASTGMTTPSKSITNVVGVTSGSGGTFPIYSQCQDYTFTFSEPIPVAPNSTITFDFNSPSNATNQRVLAFDCSSKSSTRKMQFTFQQVATSYTVTFNLDGGTRTGGGELVQTVQLGGNATPPTCEKTGYTFSSWSGSYTNVTSDRTITAQWSRIQYTVSYNANGGSGAPGNQTKYYGTDLTLSTTKPSKSYTITYNPNGGSVSPSSKSVSCIFNNWNTQTNGGGTSYLSGGKYTANASATLYAQYTNPTAGTLATPTRSNCKFVGWTTTQNGSTFVNSSTTISSSIQLYAKWEYEITFNGNGGTFQVGDNVVSSITNYKQHGTNYTIPAYYPVRYAEDGETPDSNFLYWNTTITGAGTTYNTGNNYTSNSPLTLYAIYQTKSFIVKFWDGYANHTPVKTQTVSFSQSATPPTITRDGFKFLGWSGDFTNIQSDQNFYALWESFPIWIMSSSHKWVKYEPKE